jgi:hypothetical protein
MQCVGTALTVAIAVVCAPVLLGLARQDLRETVPICTCMNIHESSMYVYTHLSGESTLCNDIGGTLHSAYLHICVVIVRCS